MIAMAEKWHVNEENRVLPCEAEVRGCGVKSGLPHFDSKEQAELWIAKQDEGYSAFGTQRGNSVKIGNANSETRAAVRKLLEKGIVVHSAKTIEQIPLAPLELSEIDILEEEVRGVPLEKLKSGSRPF